MTEKLVATVEQRRSGARVIKLAGVLDEDNRLRELGEKLSGGTVLINLAGVERINSIGGRDWVKWLAALEAQGIRPILVSCSPAIVLQLNRVKNFAGNAMVKSFQAPYHCESCDADKLLLVHVSELRDRARPSCSCDVCGARMKLTEDPVTYFAFVKDLRNQREETPSEREIDFARGSKAAVSDEHIKRVSKPRLPMRDSRPSFAAHHFRKSEHEVVMMPAPAPATSSAAYITLMLTVIVCTIGVAVAIVYLIL